MQDYINNATMYLQHVLVQTSKENPQRQSSLSWKLRMLENRCFITTKSVAINS